MEYKYDVFISYSHKDTDVADNICKALTDAGISCFFDDISVDTPDWLYKITDAIVNSKIFLYLGSKNTSTAKITPKELLLAVNHKETSSIYCYFIEEHTLPLEIEFLLVNVNQRHMSEHPVNTGLIPDIKNLLSIGFIPSKPIPTIEGNSISIAIGLLRLEMIRIDGGTLNIGATPEQTEYADTNEHPAYEVSLPTYYMSKYPITQDIWEYVMGYNKSHFRHKGDNLYKNYPAEHLTYDEAQEFVRRLSKLTNLPFSIPTEEEWEYAARGGQKSRGHIYAGSDDIEEVAWYHDNSGRTTHPVGQKFPNELGLYDMCGNVWEWTETPAHSYGIQASPGGNVFIRRGGSWWHEAKNCRVSRRYPSDHAKKTSGLGLRVVIRNNIK